MIINNMIKKIFRFIGYITIIIFMIIFPFIIERILVNELIFPFNMTIVFPREVWFGFISSYIGAIGTVGLGVIALYQNKKYKELADKSDEKFMELHENIRDLTKSNNKLITINTKIEQAKFFPILTKLPNMNYDQVEESIKDTDSLQMTIFDGCPEDFHRLARGDYDYFFENYHTFQIFFKNDCERSIRNFTCVPDIGLFKKNENQVFSQGSVSSWVCDIQPGAFLSCVLILKFDLEEEIKLGNIDSLCRKFRMENVLGEKFEMEVDINFYNEDEIFLNGNIQVSSISRI